MVSVESVFAAYQRFQGYSAAALGFQFLNACWSLELKANLENHALYPQYAAELEPLLLSLQWSKPFSNRKAITPQSQIRIRFPPLEPRSSENSRPRGFVLRWRREAAAYPPVFKGFATLLLLPESLSQRRARPDHSHDRAPVAPFLAQTLGRLSVSRRLGYQELLSLFRSQPTWVGFGVEKVMRKHSTAPLHPKSQLRLTVLRHLRSRLRRSRPRAYGQEATLA